VGQRGHHQSWPFKKNPKIISDNFDYHHPLSLARGETQPEF
jgi:hypothetical protein